MHYLVIFILVISFFCHFGHSVGLDPSHPLGTDTSTKTRIKRVYLKERNPFWLISILQKQESHCLFIVKEYINLKIIKHMIK
jgi:hypothetical protein